MVVAIITLSLGFNGAATMTNLQNSQDLAPNFAGTLYGIINFVGTTSGFISPIIVAHFTEHKVNYQQIEGKTGILFRLILQSSIEEWKFVFWIGATAYIAPALIFFVFGKGVVQKWNEPRKLQKDAIDTRL